MLGGSSFRMHFQFDLRVDEALHNKNRQRKWVGMGRWGFLVRAPIVYGLMWEFATAFQTPFVPWIWHGSNGGVSHWRMKTNPSLWSPGLTPAPSNPSSARMASTSSSCSSSIRDRLSISRSDMDAIFRPGDVGKKPRKISTALTSSIWTDQTGEWIQELLQICRAKKSHWKLEAKNKSTHKCVQ